MSNQASHGDLTKLMLFFGRLPETHVKSLQGFPFIFFNDHTSPPKLDYSVATKKEDGETTFTYEMFLNMESNNKPEERYKAFETAIRALFWKEARLSLKINGQEVFKSE